MDVDNTREALGYWHLPDGDEEIAGTLTWGNGRLPVLETVGSFHESFDPVAPYQADSILGVTNDGKKVTLIRARRTSSGLRSLDVQVPHEKWVGQALLVGAHIATAEEARHSHLDLELDVLADLLPSGLDGDITSEGQREWSWTKPATFHIECGAMDVEFEAVPHGGYASPGSHELRFWAIPRIRIAWDERVSLETVLVDAIYPMTDFCSLFADRAAKIERSVVYTSAPPPESRFDQSGVEFITNPSRRSEGDEESQGSAVLCRFDDEGLDVDDAVTKWIALWGNTDARTLIDRYFTQRGRPSHFPETTFLGHAVFLEGFHKATVDAGGATYRQRLESLMASVSPILAEASVNVTELAKCVVDTRNTFAHGRRRQGNATVDTHWIPGLNGILDTIIVGLLLGEVGIAADDLSSLMRIRIIRAKRLTTQSPWEL